MAREERLRANFGLRGTPTLALSAWRGRSGRRYVVGVHELATVDLSEIGEAVVIAVRRDGEGLGEPVLFAACGDTARDRLRKNWLRRAKRIGASELHVHRLAETADERAAIVADLDDEAFAQAGGA